MLIGFLLPLVRRLSARARTLIAAAIMAAGLALALLLARHGHAHRQNALPIRFGLLLALAGLGLLLSGVRASQRDRQRRDSGTQQRKLDTEQADRRP